MAIFFESKFNFHVASHLLLGILLLFVYYDGWENWIKLRARKSSQSENSDFHFSQKNSFVYKQINQNKVMLGIGMELKFEVRNICLDSKKMDTWIYSNNKFALSVLCFLNTKLFLKVNCQTFLSWFFKRSWTPQSDGNKSVVQY